MSASLRCPTCFSERLRTLYVVSSEEAAQGFVLREGSPARHRQLKEHINSLWGGDRCSVIQCLECDFAFADPFVSGDMFFYNLAYERSGYPNDKWEYRRTLREIAEGRLHADRVLEVGAGTGLFLDRLIESYVCRSGITALEFSDKSVKALRDKGYSVIQDDVLEAGLEPGFNAIFLFQVLEHMNKLDERFDRLSSLLLDGGILFMAVPNPAWIDFNERNGSLLDMPPNHVGRRSERAFRAIGSRHGLHLDSHEVEPFSLLEFVRMDIAFSYLRSSQQSGTIANRLRSFRSARFGKLLGGAAAVATAPRRLSVWRRAAKTPNLGISSWVKYTKSGCLKS